ncbi:DUF1295 domain-containing protein [Bacteriovoracaceae bacterium]|nr:DUF1295 domain-containing protein [Bacteriovoracaceae bacterium]
MGNKKTKTEHSFNKKGDQSNQNKKFSPLTGHSVYVGLIGLFVLILVQYFTYKNMNVSHAQFLVRQFYNIIIVGLVMGACEIFFWVKSKDYQYFNVFDLKNNDMKVFFSNWAKESLGVLFFLSLTYFFYRMMPTFKFDKPEEFYGSFFFFINGLVYIFPAFMVVYTFFTLLFHHDEDNPTPYYSSMSSIFVYFYHQLLTEESFTFPKKDLINLRSIIVKFFFIPTMFVFFISQSKSFVMNLSFLGNISQNGYHVQNLAQFNLDFLNVCQSFLFYTDVGVGLMGYLFACRWFKNTNLSIEPTMLGWVVTLLCYPPFRELYGKFFNTPSDKAFLQFETSWIVLIFIFFALSSIVIYSLSTVYFGIRFSNLTYRGVIDKGPYSLVRHPAYASKNISWWLVMFPYALFSFLGGQYQLAIFQCIGLMMISLLYYFRAITEENHLKEFEDYQSYMEKVRYRFIPYVI